MANIIGIAMAMSSFSVVAAITGAGRTLQMAAGLHANIWLALQPSAAKPSVVREEDAVVRVRARACA